MVRRGRVDCFPNSRSTTHVQLEGCYRSTIVTTSSQHTGRFSNRMVLDRTHGTRSIPYPDIEAFVRRVVRKNEPRRANRMHQVLWIVGQVHFSRLNWMGVPSIAVKEHLANRSGILVDFIIRPVSLDWIRIVRILPNE
jgi:hypothetical protein